MPLLGRTGGFVLSPAYAETGKAGWLTGSLDINYFDFLAAELPQFLIYELITLSCQGFVALPRCVGCMVTRRCISISLYLFMGLIENSLNSEQHPSQAWMPSPFRLGSSG